MTDTGVDGFPLEMPYRNRELSWLLFNRRVLEKAKEAEIPALERLKFLSISASNLDEFFMVRYASLRERKRLSDERRDASGLTAAQQLRLIGEDAGDFLREQSEVYRLHAVPVLESVGRKPLPAAELTPSQREWARECFRTQIMPGLFRANPQSAPIPGRRLHMALVLAEKKSETIAIYCLPDGMRRTWPLPRALGEGMLLVEEIISLCFQELSPLAKRCFPFRITRDEDFTVLGEADPLSETQESLKRRKTGDVVRLEVAADTPRALVRRLSGMLRAREHETYAIAAPLDLVFLSGEAASVEGFDALRYAEFIPRSVWPETMERSVFAAIREGDVFLHHPYDSFGAVLRFVRDAAEDPRVLSIKQTLYRVSGDSQIVRALCQAAEAGKQVMVLLELKARFDEENNMRWGEVLKSAGCQVLYGVPRLKTHSKITLVVRREQSGLRRYLHLGTGNYHDVTARQYTDMGLLTVNEALGEDAQSFFNMITGFSREPIMQKLVYAPKTLRPTLIALIEREAENARAGLPSGICAKMNSLVDEGIIGALYRASAAGVPISLIVRGACCLQPSVPGVSETIRVRSLVGRFLEHSRAFQFENGGEPAVFLSSADWMPRNLNRRVELMFPIENAEVKEQIMEALALQWQDTVNSFELKGDGKYARVLGEPKIDAQRVIGGGN